MVNRVSPGVIYKKIKIKANETVLENLWSNKGRRRGRRANSRTDQAAIWGCPPEVSWNVCGVLETVTPDLSRKGFEEESGMLLDIGIITP